MKRQKGISTAWKVALCAVFGAVTIAIAQNKVIPCISLLQEAFGIDMTEAGWLSSVYNVMGIAMAFPGVIIVNRLGAKKVCLISLACGILGAGVGFFARNIGLLMVGRVIEGMGAGLVSIAVPEFILRNGFRRKREGCRWGFGVPGNTSDRRYAFLWAREFLPCMDGMACGFLV